MKEPPQNQYRFGAKKKVIISPVNYGHRVLVDIIGQIFMEPIANFDVSY